MLLDLLACYWSVVTQPSVYAVRSFGLLLVSCDTAISVWCEIFWFATGLSWLSHQCMLWDLLVCFWSVVKEQSAYAVRSFGLLLVCCDTAISVHCEIFWFATGLLWKSNQCMLLDPLVCYWSVMFAIYFMHHTTYITPFTLVCQSCALFLPRRIQIAKDKWNFLCWR